MKADSVWHDTGQGRRNRLRGLRRTIAVAVVAGTLLGAASQSAGTVEPPARVVAESQCKTGCYVTIEVKIGIEPETKTNCDDGGSWKCFSNTAGETPPDSHSKGAVDPIQH